ncbi:MAG TPA: hypothetical protein PLG47_04510, partial [Candidatus Dojkabacteria bacterium]|nr:hypothetical protein [Candidatus Dojkabacteria bacterium]
QPHRGELPRAADQRRSAPMLRYQTMLGFTAMLGFMGMLGERAHYKFKDQGIPSQNVKKDFYKSDASVTLSRSGNFTSKQLEKLKVTRRNKSRNINCILT